MADPAQGAPSLAECIEWVEGLLSTERKIAAKLPLARHTVALAEATLAMLKERLAMEAELADAARECMRDLCDDGGPF